MNRSVRTKMESFPQVIHMSGTSVLTNAEYKSFKKSEDEQQLVSP